MGERIGLHVHTALGVVGHRHQRGRAQPHLHLVRIDVQPARDVGLALDRLGRLAQVPLRHEVRVDVVVHHRGVLVRAGHPVDAEAVLGVEVAERGPQPGGLDQQFRAEVAVEVLVEGGVVVADDGIGDVGVDVEGRRPRRPVARGLLAADRPPRERRAPAAEHPGPVAGHVQRRVPPAQRVADGVRRGVGEHRQHVGLGVPEGVPVVAGAGEPLGGDRLPLAAQSGLQDVEHAHADGLLQLLVALDLDVGLVPVLVQQVPLLADQPVPAGQLRRRQGRLHLVAQCRARAARGPAVGQELDQLQRATRRDAGGQGVPGEVAVGLDVLGARVGDLDGVVHAGRHAQPAALGLVHQHGPTPATDRVLGLQRLRQRGRGARVVRLRRRHLVGQQVRLQGDVQVAQVVGELDLVLDGGDRPAGERDQPGAGDPHGPATRRAPLGGPAQHAGAQVERAGVLDDLPVVEVER